MAIDGGHQFCGGKTANLCTVCGSGRFAAIHQQLYGPLSDALTLRALRAIETAITSEDGLDGLEGEAILREAGYYPPRRKSKGASPGA